MITLENTAGKLWQKAVIIRKTWDYEETYNKEC